MKRYSHHIIRLLCWSAVVAGVGLACTGRGSLFLATPQVTDVRVISGHVLDAEGQPCSGAVVHFYGLSPVRSEGAARGVGGEQTWAVVCDSSGHFFIKGNLPARGYVEAVSGTDSVQKEMKLNSDSAYSPVTLTVSRDKVAGRI